MYVLIIYVDVAKCMAKLVCNYHCLLFEQGTSEGDPTSSQPILRSTSFPARAFTQFESEKKQFGKVT